MNNVCNGLMSQKFIMPSQWLPAITLNRVRTFANSSLCMDVASDWKVIMATCNIAKVSQVFEYNAVTRQVRQNSRCMDGSRTSPYSAYMNSCHDGNNQKWYLDTSTNSLRIGDRSSCVGRNGHSLYVMKCDGGFSEQYFFPEGLRVSAQAPMMKFALL